MTIEIQNIIIFKGELRSNYIFLYSTSIGLEYNPIQNNELFFYFKTHISISFAQDIQGLLFTSMNIF